MSAGIRLLCSRLPVILAVLLGQAQVWAAPERPEVGQVVRTQGECLAAFAGTTRSLADSGPVFYEDLLETGDKARLAAVLVDGSELTLGAGASLLIDEFVYSPQSTGGKLNLQILEGAFLFVGGKLEANPDAKVHIGTRVGALGIRGTKVWGGMIDGAYGVLVLDGQVDVTNDGGRVVLGTGEGTMVAGADVAPTTPKTWPDEKVQRAFATVSFDEN